MALLFVLTGDLYFVSIGQNELDPALILMLRTPGHLSEPLGPPWLAETGRDITALGSNGVVALIVLTACGGLALARRWQYVLALLLSSGSALVCNGLIKVAVHRSRPNLVPDTPPVFTTTFPSSHAMMSAATFFCLAAIVAASSSSRTLGRFCFVMAAICTGLIGLSRVYLAVHWPTDVLGGWAGGLLCALTGWTVADHISKQGIVSATDRDPAQEHGRAH